MYHNLDSTINILFYLLYHDYIHLYPSVDLTYFLLTCSYLCSDQLQYIFFFLVHLFIYLFISGCTGSSLLSVGFL